MILCQFDATLGGCQRCATTALRAIHPHSPQNERGVPAPHAIDPTIMNRENLLRSGVAYIDLDLFENKMGQRDCPYMVSRPLSVWDVLTVYEELGLINDRFPSRSWASTVTKLVMDRLHLNFAIPKEVK